MNNNFTARIVVLFFLVVLSGCASVSPTYIDDGNLSQENKDATALNPVHYELEDSFIASPPKCIAIMPLTTGIKTSDKDDRRLSEESMEQLRWSLYSQLAPYPFNDIELARVNKALSATENKEDYQIIGSLLQCDALLLTEVTDYHTGFFGIYSNTAIGVKMTLIRTENSEMLWTGNHVAQSSGGSIPLTPVDIVVGLYSATENLSDEQLVRVKDDVFRRLLSTWDVDNILHPDAFEDIESLQLAEAEKTQQAEKEMVQSSVAVYSLWLRSGPGKKFAQTGVLYQQDRLEIIDTNYSPWVQVKVADGRSGYVNSKYINSF
jgi:hypothetical protein